MGSLVPITELIPEDHPRKTEVLKAWQAYEDRSALPEIVNLLDTYLQNPLLNCSTFLRDIKQKAEDGMEHGPIPEAGISHELEKKIADYVTTPAWFKQTLLCFRYGGKDEVCHRIDEVPEFVNEKARDPLQECNGTMPERQALGLNGTIYFKTPSSVGRDLLEEWQANFTLSHSEYDYKVCIQINGEYGV